jgi:hypothetical protein
MAGWSRFSLRPRSGPDPRWYGPGEEGALEAELGRVDALLAWMEQGAPAVENVVHLLSEFHDIKNSFQPTPIPHGRGGAL